MNRISPRIIGLIPTESMDIYNPLKMGFHGAFSNS
jgi:hypothetical protein